MRKILLLLVVVATAVCCNGNKTNPIKTQPLTLLVEVAAPSAVNSRVDFTDPGDGTYDVKWAKEDALGLWCAEGQDKFFSKFVVDKFDENNCTFKGELNSYSYPTAVRFIHPYPEKFQKINPFTFYVDFSNQTFEDDLAHLNKNTFMISDPIEVNSDGVIDQSLSMKHLGSVIDLSVICQEAKGYTLTSVEVSSEKLPTGMEVNLSEDKTFETAATGVDNGTIAINVPNGIKSEDGNFASIPFNILPFELKNGDQITFTVEFLDGNDVTHTAVKTITVGEDVDFGRAMRHQVEVTFTDELIAETVVSLSEESLEFGWNDTDTKTVTIMGYSAGDKVAVQVIGDDAAEFVADNYDNGQFGVYPYLQNFTSNEYSAQIEVTVNGTVLYLDVTQESRY